MQFSEKKIVIKKINITNEKEGDKSPRRSQFTS